MVEGGVQGNREACSMAAGQAVRCELQQERLAVADVCGSPACSFSDWL
jgi:hypothetical protein